MTTWTPDTPPPCTECGGEMRLDTPDGRRPCLVCWSCGRERQRHREHYTVATAPWTRDLWAELVSVATERTGLLMQLVAEEQSAMTSAGILADVVDALWPGEDRAETHGYEGAVDRARELVAEMARARWERDSARRDLARIVQLCGWDCDGNDPESPTGAIHLYGDGFQAVRELRQEHAEDLAQVEAERDTLAARVRELEALGECQSVPKLREALAALVEAVADEGPVTAAVAPAWDRACAVLSAGWREGQGRDGGEGSTDALATLRRRIADLHEVLCSDADEATLRRAVSSLVYEARGRGEDR